MFLFKKKKSDLTSTSTRIDNSIISSTKEVMFSLCFVFLVVCPQDYTNYWTDVQGFSSE